MPENVQVNHLVEYIQAKDGGLPKLHIAVVVREKDGSLTYHNRYLCNFRRYDWCWTNDKQGEQGYCSGVDICNGGGRELPARSVDELLAVSLAVGFDRMMSGLLRDVVSGYADAVYSDLTEEQKERYHQAKTAVHSVRDACRVPLGLLLEDAQAYQKKHGLPSFARVQEGYTGAVVAFPAKIRMVGFSDEALESCHKEQAIRAIQSIVRSAERYAKGEDVMARKEVEACREAIARHGNTYHAEVISAMCSGLSQVDRLLA